MQELLRSNDLVLLSYVEALCREISVICFIADEHMSALDGSLPFLPRRVLVPEEDYPRACRMLREAELGPMLSPPAND